MIFSSDDIKKLMEKIKLISEYVTESIIDGNFFYDLNYLKKKNTNLLKLNYFKIDLFFSITTSNQIYLDVSNNLEFSSDIQKIIEILDYLEFN